jgi:hypothetical protein
MKRLFFIFCSIVFYINPSSAQLCPGGGVDFLTAVTFDPAWIYGCNTGTSCNGGVALDNRTACIPITLLDVCAPAPSCGVATNASNAWFKFFAIGNTATISCFQNTSFVIGIQAFSGGPLCGTLTQLGCALAGGPSSGVQLSLTGLTPGNLYYFRIFGSATPVSQRTGLYCFCGTTGLSNTILPVNMVNLKGTSKDGNAVLDWNAGYENIYVEVERSIDGKNFTSLQQLSNNASPTYIYTDASAITGNNYYRLKQIAADGKYSYSNTIVIKIDRVKLFDVYADAGLRQLQVKTAANTTVAIYSAAGSLQQVTHLSAGFHSISTAQMSKGFYFLRADGVKAITKFYVN